MIKQIAYGFFCILLTACSNSNNSGNNRLELLPEPDKDLREKSETPQLSDSITAVGGVYSFGTKAELGPVGSISVYPLTNHSALFFLDVSRGAPSYNMGQLLGEMQIKNNKGIYYAKDDASSCSITFDFNSHQVKLSSKEVEGGCGFGHGVIIDNTYEKQKISIPKYFINGEGDTTLFKGLTVYKYEHRFD